VTTYYVFAPGIKDFPTAEVTAPDTKHARTSYLDYLARSGIIRWSQRGEVRKFVKTSRMAPGGIQTSVSLSYGVTEPVEQGLPIPAEQPLEELPAETQAEVTPEATPQVTTPVTTPVTVRQPVSPVMELSRKTVSPVMELSKKSRGL